MNRGFLTRFAGTATLAVSVAILGACSSGSGAEDSPGAANAQADESVRAMLPAAIRDAGVLRVGTPIHNPPVIFKNGSEVEGLGADLVSAIADTMGLRVQYVETAFPGVFPGLAAGKFDVIGGVVLADTAEREKSADIVSLNVNESALLTRKEKSAEINSLDDLCGRPVGTLQGSAQEKLLSAESKQCVSAGKAEIAIKLYPDAPTVLAQLQAGRVDAFGATLPYAAYMAKTVQNGEALAVAKEIIPVGVSGIAAPKGEEQLAKSLQAAIKKIIADGRYASIHEKWGVTNRTLREDDVVINGASQGAFAEYGG